MWISTCLQVLWMGETTYLLMSSECTLYLLSILYLPGLASGSSATLFLYLERQKKFEKNKTKSSEETLKTRWI